MTQYRPTNYGGHGYAPPPPRAPDPPPDHIKADLGFGWLTLVVGVFGIGMRIFNILVLQWVDTKLPKTESSESLQPSTFSIAMDGIGFVLDLLVIVLGALMMRGQRWVFLATAIVVGLSLTHGLVDGGGIAGSVFHLTIFGYSIYRFKGDEG